MRAITELMTDVNRVAQLPDVEALRGPLIRYVVEVYKKVGYRSFQTEKSKFTVVNKSISLPVATVKVFDVKTTVNGEVGEKDSEYYVGCILASPLSRVVTDLHCKIYNDKIKFLSSKIKSVIVEYGMLPCEDTGEILIDEDIYSACVAYCSYQELLIKSSNTKQERSTLNPASFYKRESDRLIDEARAFMNSWSAIEEREIELTNIIETTYL